MPAGLGEVPCWVEGMDDEAAFLELVKSNRQSEPTPLECEVHAKTVISPPAWAVGA
jgi:hypothetical protein